MTAEELSPRDRERLAGVHPDLVRVVEAARRRADFMVVEGLRTRERQALLVAAGASQTYASRHLTGHAVDLAPRIEGEVRWDWPLYDLLGPVVKAEAARLGVRIVWGGDWTGFRDGPHFELDRRDYPA